MLKKKIFIFLSVVYLLVISHFCYGDCHSEVIKILDSWSSRSKAHAAIVNLGDCGFSEICKIIKNQEESFLRRSRIISLLGMFKNSESIQVLEKASDSNDHNLRCLALQSLAEIGTMDVIPILIRKLDDNSVCMKKILTDPGREEEIYVSDESVRLLEDLLKISFERKKQPIIIHRDTKPWKDWWEKNKDKYLKEEKNSKNCNHN